jgi:epoxyqueuosine reductase
MSLEKEIIELLKSLGAISVGFANLETLAGGPPSADIRYVMPSAKSAISFALPENKEFLQRFLAKEDILSHEKDHLTTTIYSGQISEKVKDFLESKGYKSSGVLGSGVYRRELPDWNINMYPNLSQRYVAVRSGVGSFGWSGNVGMKGYGSAILLGSVLTEAELTPTEPISESESFCCKCKLCAASCVGKTFSAEEEEYVTLGGRTFSFAKRKSYVTCHIVAGGMTGLHESGQWSTWSPGRFRVPEDEKELMEEYERTSRLYEKRVHVNDGGFPGDQFVGGRLRITCGVCALVCTGSREENEENYRILTSSGCVVQDESGKKLVLPAVEAAARFESFKPEHKDLYRYLQRSVSIRPTV